MSPLLMRAGTAWFQQLAALLKELVAYRNVPVFKLEVYQEGAVSPAGVELFQAAGKAARGLR
jgi:hypothetical protein